MLERKILNCTSIQSISGRGISNRPWTIRAISRRLAPICPPGFYTKYTTHSNLVTSIVVCVTSTHEHRNSANIRSLPHTHAQSIHSTTAVSPSPSSPSPAVFVQWVRLHQLELEQAAGRHREFVDLVEFVPADKTHMLGGSFSHQGLGTAPVRWLKKSALVTVDASIGLVVTLFPITACVCLWYKSLSPSKQSSNPNRNPNDIEIPQQNPELLFLIKEKVYRK